ncbi:hypothetical protein [Erythrobacter sp. CCH5-A1]|jgi:hypothetical protein|uniref:hypothetical protein n=1 Tax=Erythrobacter sp. CCH5-A1 TaxID=1768792 RepID=UPI000833E519|nr:hypothetical protein [Erythrobacter sp. CCH5-A1]
MSDTPASAPTTHIVDPASLVPDVAPEAQARFVEVLAQWGNVRAAAAQAGVSRAHLYRMRRASPEFRRMWDAALVLARPQVEEVLADRALNGVAETVYYHGEEVATRTRFDTRLLLAHLGRLDRVEDTQGVRAAVLDFDERVEALRNPPVTIAWDGEDEDLPEDGAEGTQEG